MTLPIIQSLWIGADLSPLEKLCIQSFIDHGHEFHLYIYDNIGGIPTGAAVKDGNEILPANEIYRQGSKQNLGGFSNWFRYALLAKKGNFWVDMDMVCIKPFDFEGIVFGHGYSHRCETAVLMFPAGHGFTKMMEYSCRNHAAEMPWDNEQIRKRKTAQRQKNIQKKDMGFGEVGGPEVLTRAIRHSGLDEYAKPFTYFYPIGYEEFERIFDNSFADGIKLYHQTHGIHLWNEAYRRNPDFNKTASFDERSLVEHLKRKHGIMPSDYAPPPNEFR